MRILKIVLAVALWNSSSFVSSAEITGRAIDLTGRTIPNIKELAVVAETASGTALNRMPAKIDEKAGTYTITIDEDLLQSSGSVFVNLRFSAPGRLTFTTTTSGQTDQRVDAVLPTAEEMMEYMRTQGYVHESPSCCCCQAPRRFFRRRFFRCR